MSDAGPPVAVGIDIGGTKLVAASIGADGTVITRARETSPVADADALVRVVGDLVADLGPGLPLGIGVAGIVAPDGTLRYAPNLDLADLALGALVAERTGVRPTVLNDATAAVVAEARVGAAAGCDDVVLLTIGTGIGGGLLVGGRVVEGAHGFGAELGHLIVAEGGRTCPCGNTGCLEAYASGTAIGAIAAERVAAGAESLLAEAAAIDGKAVSAAAQAGDDLSRVVLAEVGRWLGIGMASLVNALDPEIVVIGGGAASHTAGWVVPAASAAMAERVIGAPPRGLPPIVLAQLGDDAGMVGAALAALERREP